MTSRSTWANRSAIARMCRTLKFTFSTPVISHWTRLQMRSSPWSEHLSLLHVRSRKRGAPVDAVSENAATYNREVSGDHQRTIEDFTCDLTSFQELSSPTTSFPTTARNAGSSPSCKDNIRWFLSSAAEVSAPKTGGKLKGWLNSTV